MKRLRNIAAIALVAGIAVGVWLADWFKGLGSGDGVGIGQSGLSEMQTSAAGTTRNPASMPADDAAAQNAATPATASATAARAVSLVITDRSFLWQTDAGEQPVTLQRILQLVAAAPGDEDGHRIKIARAASSRPTTELELQDALQQAGIPEAAIYWKPGVAEKSE